MQLHEVIVELGGMDKPPVLVAPAMLVEVAKLTEELDLKLSMRTAESTPLAL